MDFAETSSWYDGYVFRKFHHVYNPRSVVGAMRYRKFSSYWTSTETYEALKIYMDMDYDGLRQDIVQMLGGGRVTVNTYSFQNDMQNFKTKDDVLTLLIHLGYLAYDEEAQKVRIPNEEIRLEFARAIQQVKRDETIWRVRESEQLIIATVHQDEEAVARQIEKIHEEESPLYYNNEQVLRSVIKRAYFSYGDEYVMFEKLPAGERKHWCRIEKYDM